jgi:hypothetical protein
MCSALFFNQCLDSSDSNKEEGMPLGMQTTV